MRAYIKREDLDCKEILLKVDEEKNTGADYFDVAHWLYESEESFHGELVCVNGVDSFVFKDARLPEFDLPLKFVKLDE